LKWNRTLLTSQEVILKTLYKIEELEYLIKTCLNFEMIDESFFYILKLLELEGPYLSVEERNLLMKTAKGKLSKLRNARKNLLDYEQIEGEINFYSIPKNFVDSEISLLEESIKSFCCNIVEKIEKLEMNIKDDTVAEIFFKKLKADYFRYYAEVCEGAEFNEFVELARENYQNAYEKCLINLEPQNPLTLSVALNYSVFLYFLMDELIQACNISEKIYRQAVINLNTEEKNPEVDALLKSIEENLTLWKIEAIDVN